MIEMNKIYNMDALDFMKQVPDKYFDLVLKPAYGKLRTQLYTLNVIQSEYHDDHGDLHLSVCIAPHKLEQLIKQAHLPLDEILGKKASLFERALEEFERNDNSSL